MLGRERMSCLLSKIYFSPKHIVLDSLFSLPKVIFLPLTINLYIAMASRLPTFSVWIINDVALSVGSTLFSPRTRAPDISNAIHVNGESKIKQNKMYCLIKTSLEKNYSKLHTVPGS